MPAGQPPAGPASMALGLALASGADEADRTGAALTGAALPGAALADAGADVVGGGLGFSSHAPHAAPHSARARFERSRPSTATL